MAPTSTHQPHLLFEDKTDDARMFYKGVRGVCVCVYVSVYLFDCILPHAHKRRKLEERYIFRPRVHFKYT